jgi:hypothetical protein
MSNDIKPMGYLTEEHQVISPGIHKVGMSPVYDSAALDLARQQGRNDALIYNGMADRHEKDVLVVELRDQLATAQRLQAELSEVSPAKKCRAVSYSFPRRLVQCLERRGVQYRKMHCIFL